MLNSRASSCLYRMALRNFGRHSPSARSSKLEPSVWIEFTTLAVQHQAVNLGQGFPDFSAPRFVTDILKDIASKPEVTAAHQYTRGYGHPDLVKILATMYSDFYNTKVDPLEEVLVTNGAYLALYYAFQAWIQKGDEVLLIEPTYDCYYPQVEMAGGTPVAVTMKLPKNAKSANEYQIDFEEMEKKINNKTKMIVLNNPSNPTGKLFSRAELEKIAALAVKYDLIVIADEVYEFHVWNGEMIRFASLPGMYERTISVGSAGKAFSVTGWKTGWAVAPKHLLQPLMRIHQQVVFTCNTPVQAAIAKAFEIDYPLYKANPKESYLATGIASELVEKRDILANMLRSAGFKPILPEAGYFLMADYSDVAGDVVGSEKESRDFVFSKWLTSEKKLATIPTTAFVSTVEGKKENENLIRFCFFKKSETLEAAKKILEKFAEDRKPKA